MRSISRSISNSLGSTRCAVVCGSRVRLPVSMTRMFALTSALEAGLGCTPTERQLRTNTLGLSRDRRRNFTTTFSAACQVEAFGVRIRINGHAEGPAPKSGLEGMSHQCSPDTAVHELRQDPKMVELPRLSRRHQGVEAGNLVSDRCDEGRPRGNGVARDAEVLPPQFDCVGRVAPIRLCLERESGKSFCFVFLRSADVHFATSLSGEVSEHHFIDGVADGAGVASMMERASRFENPCFRSAS